MRIEWATTCRSWQRNDDGSFDIQEGTLDVWRPLIIPNDLYVPIVASLTAPSTDIGAESELSWVPRGPDGNDAGERAAFR